jgi:ribosomal protein S18 acetylase RimI-like enzyme
MTEIKSLENIDFDSIFEAFSQAFIDYEFQLSKRQLQAMLKRRGFIPNASFAAFEGNKIVSFVLNGIGKYNGIQTAYDTGTGTLKNYRGKGLATAIFEYSIPYLRKMNINQYLLEVLQHNTKAFSVYKKLGFEVVREFNYYIQKNEEVNYKAKPLYSSNIIKKFDLVEYGSISDFWDFYPSWQNSFESIQRSAEEFICLGVFNGKNLIGYCIFDPHSGDITQIAVDKQNRRNGIATLLLGEMIKLNKNNTIYIGNTDILCDSINSFLKSKNIDIKGKQYEMIKTID